MGNKNMHAAKRNKNDEFYTQIGDIERELINYREQFKDKVVYLNCDNPMYENLEGDMEIHKDGSHFWNFFYLQFELLGLKKLIATHYDAEKPTYKLEYTGGGIKNVVKTDLKQNGDFRSDESIEILEEADIVCTNPPFSLFREYVAQLIEYEKEFLIIGNFNAVTYKEVFPLIKDNKIWLGYNSPKEFVQPDGSIKKVFTHWFTNMDVSKRHEDIFLYKDYKGNEDAYPKYDNYDAIEVSRIKHIPRDYEGVMGVPITFLKRYNPNQFEMLGMAHGLMGQEIGVSSNLTEEQCKEYYKKNKAFRKGFVCYTDKNNNLKVPYMRVLIKNKNPEIKEDTED